MERVLDSISKVAGINGVAVFRGEECLGHNLKSPFEPVVLSAVVQHLQSLSDFNTSLDEDAEVKNLFVRFDRGLLMVRKVEDLILLAIAEAGANPAILQVAFHAAAMKLTRICQGLELSTSHGSLNSSYRSETSLERFWDSAVPTDAVGQAFVWELANSYKRHAGPSAAQAIDDELTRLDVTPMTLRNYQVEELVQALAGRLVNPRSRTAFAGEVFGMRRMV